MKKVDIADERLESIVSHCRPLRVEVSLRKVKDKYYIHFDGSKTYQSSDKWKLLWSGFENYVTPILRIHGFSDKSVVLKKDCYAVAFIGTLFDFLKAEK